MWGFDAEDGSEASKATSQASDMSLGCLRHVAWLDDTRIECERKPPTSSPRRRGSHLEDDDEGVARHGGGDDAQQLPRRGREGGARRVKRRGCEASGEASSDGPGAGPKGERAALVREVSARPRQVRQN